MWKKSQNNKNSSTLLNSYGQVSLLFFPWVLTVSLFIIWMLLDQFYLFQKTKYQMELDQKMVNLIQSHESTLEEMKKIETKMNALRFSLQVAKIHPALEASLKAWLVYYAFLQTKAFFEWNASILKMQQSKHQVYFLPFPYTPQLPDSVGPKPMRLHRKSCFYFGKNKFRKNYAILQTKDEKDWKAKWIPNSIPKAQWFWKGSYGLSY